jgi:cell fate (sporulation/competence/biofilm development) regulator YmcA (YheA/YmcA/DUF963 family)
MGYFSNGNLKRQIIKKANIIATYQSQVKTVSQTVKICKKKDELKTVQKRSIKNFEKNLKKYWIIVGYRGIL